jgi:hypothetical protein
MFGRSREPRSRGRAGRRPRRLSGCLLLILGLIAALIILSLLFGGFQKGTKATGAPVHRPGPITVAVTRSR